MQKHLLWRANGEAVQARCDVPGGNVAISAERQAKVVPNRDMPIWSDIFFSSAKHEYFCCSKNVKAKRTFMRRKHDGCERGRALLFPNTQEPVSCEPAKKGRPVGYACLPNISNQMYQCCSIAMSKDNEMMFEEVEIECPSYMTRVEREVNGVIKTFCEKPPAQ
ncbi:unnamed protein product, partial [Mesorhabditis spiculigera]